MTLATAREELEKLSSLVDMHTHVGSGFDNRVTFTFDVLF